MIMETKYIPILYQQDMVLACLDGTKTQTRRTKGLEKINETPEKYRYNRPTNNLDFAGFGYHIFLDDEINTVAYLIKCPYGSVGDILWVRENFYTASNWDHWKPSQLQSINEKVYFQADILNFNTARPLNRGKIRPNIFLPFHYARIFLKIKSIRLEKLNTISESDAIAEGIHREKYVLDENVTIYRNYLPGKDFYSFSEYSWNFGKESHSAAVASYCSLWEEINGEGSWNSNPWVWVIEFERIDKPDNLIK